MSATRVFLRQSGGRGQLIEAIPTSRGWQIIDGADFIGEVLIEAKGYSWIPLEDSGTLQGECLSLLEAVSQLVGSEVREGLS